MSTAFKEETSSDFVTSKMLLIMPKMYGSWPISKCKHSLLLRELSYSSDSVRLRVDRIKGKVKKKGIQRRKLSSLIICLCHTPKVNKILAHTRKTFEFSLLTQRHKWTATRSDLGTFPNYNIQVRPLNEKWHIKPAQPVKGISLVGTPTDFFDKISHTDESSINRSFVWYGRHRTEMRRSKWKWLLFLLPNEIYNFSSTNI